MEDGLYQSIHFMGGYDLMIHTVDLMAPTWHGTMYPSDHWPFRCIVIETATCVSLHGGLVS